MDPLKSLFGGDRGKAGKLEVQGQPQLHLGQPGLTKMAQEVKVFAAKTGYPSLVSKTHIVEGEKLLRKALF